MKGTFYYTSYLQKKVSLWPYQQMWQKKILKISRWSSISSRWKFLLSSLDVNHSISIINNKSFFDLERVVSFSDKILQWFKQLVHKIERDVLISRDQWMIEHQQRRFFVFVDMTIRSNDKEKKRILQMINERNLPDPLHYLWIYSCTCQSSNQCRLLKKRWCKKMS